MLLASPALASDAPDKIRNSAAVQEAYLGTDLDDDA